MTGNEKKTAPDWASRALAEAIKRDMDGVAAAVEAMKQNPAVEAAKVIAAFERDSNAAMAKALHTSEAELRAASVFEQQKAWHESADSLLDGFRVREPAVPYLPEIPPVEETPIGRTMVAVEALTESAKRMEAAVGNVTHLATRVAELIADVIKQIRENAQAFQEQSERQTRKAVTFAKWSLAVSVLALAISAGFSIKSYLVQVQQLRAENAESAQMLREVREQNAQLKTIARELHAR